MKYLTAADFAVYIHWMELLVLAERERPNELDPDIQKGWRDYVTTSMTLNQAERLMVDERVPTSIFTRVMEKVFGGESGLDLSAIAEMFEERSVSPLALPESETIVRIERTYPRVYSVF
ncbi:MAG: hypothetical protein M1600_09795 [Firmicutes bacterium]|nr:hypothetical protein [Bacillota bacterium]